MAMRLPSYHTWLEALWIMRSLISDETKIGQDRDNSHCPGQLSVKAYFILSRSTNTNVAPIPIPSQPNPEEWCKAAGEQGQGREDCREKGSGQIHHVNTNNEARDPNSLFPGLLSHQIRDAQFGGFLSPHGNGIVVCMRRRTGRMKMRWISYRVDDGPGQYCNISHGTIRNEANLYLRRVKCQGMSSA